MPDALTAALCADVLGGRFWWHYQVLTGPSLDHLTTLTPDSPEMVVIKAPYKLKDLGCV